MDRANTRPMSRRQFLEIVSLTCGFAITSACARSAGQDQAPVGESDIATLDESYGSLGGARSVAEISKSTSFVVGICSDAKPYGFLNGDGNFIGLDAAMAEGVAWDIGAYVRYVETDPADIGSYLKAHKVDAVICSSAPAAPGCLQAQPFIAARQAVVTKKDGTIKGLGDLSGKAVAVCADTFAERFLDGASTGADIRRCASYAAALQQIKSGDVAALCIDQLIGRAWVKDNKDFAVALDDLGDPCEAGIQVAPGNEDLLQNLDHETFALVKENNIRKAFDKHVVPAVPDAKYDDFILKVKDA